MTSAADLPAAAGSNLAFNQNAKETFLDPHKTATGVYVTVHGHFYQPPRENPYLDAVERQAGAAPFHDWNERIHHECYRPNAFARVLNEQNEVVGIVNNYEYLSFNIGATLMSWLERYDLEVYQRILEADRKSCDRLNGHGNAIAQVYNHTIMPLANERDKYTQIRWGKADFHSRFGRNPEGMWLAETAVDYATLKALVQEGIRFIILAPSQAQRCRPFPTDAEPASEWHEVGGSQIDPTRPYRCFLKGARSQEPGARESSFPATGWERDGDTYIDIFFYDGPISRDMGFSDTLNNCHHLIGRIGQAVRGDHRASQLISVATDGETFGHHKAGTEKTLAYAFLAEFPAQGWQVTNFAHYLSLDPPTWEVELKPVTAWSCAHGVDRWQDDCGCGGGGGWHQKWRRPLRDSLDWLRDQLIDVYSFVGRQLLRDPWQARDEYIQVMRDRSPENVSHFLSRHQAHELTASEQVDALRLLEMQRHALLMYTSCGWFFEELSRPEGTQILRYAARAMELAGDVAGVQLEKEFINRLTLAPSNVDFFKHGGEVYRQLVLTAQISIKQVAAQYAITSLFRKGLGRQESQVRTITNYSLPITNYQTPHFSLRTSSRFANTPSPSQHIYCYTAHQLDYQLQRIGTLTLAVGQVKLVSEITWESEHLIFAVLHLGGWDFHCCIQPFTGRRKYSQMREKVFEALQQASAAHAIGVMMQMFGDQSFSLQDLLPEERHRIMQLLSQETLTRLDQLYTQVYRDNYGVLMAFHRDQLPVPQELQVAAQIALSHRCLHLVRSLCEEIGMSQSFWDHLGELETLALEAKHLRCQLNIPQGKQTLEQLIGRSLWQLLHNTNGGIEAVQRLERLIDVAYQLNLGLSIDRVQEIYFGYLHSQIVPWCLHQQNQLAPADRHHNSNQPSWDTNQLRLLLKLGQKLGVDVSFWLNQLN